MIKLENVVLASPEQMAFIIEGMRNPMNSWEKSDSTIVKTDHEVDDYIDIGKTDYLLMQRLSKAGTDHRKFMRMMPVYVRITAPLYWWKEFDTYKVGTVIVKAIVAGLDFKTKLLIGLDQGPKWFENILVFQGALVCLDFIGVIYSVIWLLFFR